MCWLWLWESECSDVVEPDPEEVAVLVRVWAVSVLARGGSKLNLKLGVGVVELELELDSKRERSFLSCGNPCEEELEYAGGGDRIGGPLATWNVRFGGVGGPTVSAIGADGPPAEGPGLREELGSRELRCCDESESTEMERDREDVEPLREESTENLCSRVDLFEVVFVFECMDVLLGDELSVPGSGGGGGGLCGACPCSEVSENWRGRDVVRGVGRVRTGTPFVCVEEMVVVGECGRSVYRYCEPEATRARRAWIARISSSEKPASIRDEDHDGGRPTYLRMVSRY